MITEPVFHQRLLLSTTAFQSTSKPSGRFSPIAALTFALSQSASRLLSFPVQSSAVAPLPIGPV
jgi:hypothetical protein